MVDGYVGKLNDSELKPNNIIYSFPTFSVPLGCKIIETVQSPNWHTVMLKPIDIVQFEIVNENDGKIGFKRF